MSLILDAIKKSERERQQQDVPDLASNHEAYQTETLAKKWWPLVVVVIVLGFTAVLYFIDVTAYFSTGKTRTAELIEDKSSLQQSIAKIETAAKVNPSTTQTEPVIENKKSNRILVSEPTEEELAKIRNRSKKRTAVKVKKPQPKAKPKSKPKPTLNNSVINIQQLSSALQRKLPAIKFSSHVFTGEQTTSFVVLNDEMLGVGEMFNGNIKIIQISKSGLIIELEKQQAFLAALQSWQP